MSISIAIFMEAFVSIHMSMFVLKPLSEMIAKENSNQLFWTLFGIRAGILLFCDLFVTPFIAILDFFMVFIGAFIVVPVFALVTRTPINHKSNQVLNKIESNTNTNTSDNANNPQENIVLKCTECGAILKVEDKFCPSCGAPFDGNNVQVTEKTPIPQDTSPIVTYDSTYYVRERTILKNMLIEELNNRGEDINLLATAKTNKNKNILLLVLGILTLIITLLYYFNYSILLCALIEIIFFLIYLWINQHFNVLNILIKEAIKNPDTDITKLVNDIRNEKINPILPNRKKIIITMLIAILIPSILFFTPKVIYTSYGDGYQVFRYTRGVISNEEVTIPDTYNGKKVIAIGEGAFKNSNVKKVTLPKTIESIKIDAFRNANNIESISLPSSVVEIRANAFANMANLTTISLPEGLKDIRGGAFAYDPKLTNVTLPSTLEYLGAGAFSHCSSITVITIPRKVTEINGQTFEYMTSLKKVNFHDNITYIHGEVFVGDINLDNVVLPPKITEIKGNTFENCKSLSSIEIPYGVTRIGGHAFYGCSKLSHVSIPLSVTEIGSSAFRNCNSLKYIEIPKNTLVNERAFKESPTVISYY